MMRDKKELEKSLRYFRHKAEYTVESDERKEMYAIATETVEKVLNPDFVEVVRCRECRWRKGPMCSMEYHNDETREQYTWELDNDFCSYGERREEG